MYKSILAGLVLSAALMGCNSTANDTDTVAKANSKESDDTICKMEKQVGSNMMRRVCYTVEERDRMRDSAREAMTRMQTGSEVGNN